MPVIRTYITKKKFDQFNRNLPVAVRNHIDELLDDIVLYAKAFAAIDTGAMRQSIRRTPRGVAVGGGIVNYSTYVEFGTYKMAAQPFIRPAIQVVMPGAFRYFAGIGRELIN